VTAGGSYLLPTYPFRVPPELAGGEARRYPVVIVGGGLSGLTAACDLAVRGIETVLLDEDDTIGVRGASSRGIVYARKTLEVFRRLGIYERVAQKGVQWFVGRTLVNDEIVYEFDMKQVTSSEQPAFLNLQQFYVEWFLVDRIMELGRTDLRWKNKVIGVSPSKDFVSLDVETPAGRYTLQADWVIDASGLASVIRNGLGLQTHADKSTEDRWCITDVRFTKKLPQERWTWVEGEANEGRAIWQHPLADGVWRLDFQMAPNSDPAYVSREDVACDRLRRHLGEGVDFELVWVGPYSYRAHLLDDFRAGRVFFIGDSAHVVSPFGARGGNTGVQDAENLAWKLALVLRGQAPEVLLETYSEERYAAARTNLDVTRRSARFLAPRSAAERTLRNAVIALARRYPFARSMVNTGRLSAPHTYANSSLITTGGQAVQNVPLLLPDGQRGCLVDLVGDGFLVLWWQAAGMEMPKIPQARVVVVTPAMDMTGSLTRELSDGPGSAALIRPDLHLAARLPASRLGELSAALARAMKRSD
jgi:3-(3-hydroxy-phenyl)propionate hydroxylase